SPPVGPSVAAGALREAALGVLRLAVEAGRHPLAAHQGAAHRRDHLVGRILRHLDDREPVLHHDLADLAPAEPGLVGDRADEVLRAHTGVAADVEVDAGDRALECRLLAALAPLVAATTALEPAIRAILALVARHDVGDLDLVDDRTVRLVHQLERGRGDV